MNCYVKSWNALAAKKDGKKLTLIDIVILMRSRLTHSEFQFSKRYLGISFSSTGADNANGVRGKFIDYDKHPLRWETVEIPLTDEQEDMIFQEACRMADVLCYFDPLTKQMPDIVSTINRLKYQHKFHPNEIWQGNDHIRYDYAGLLSHALKRSKKWWLNVFRGVFWGWSIAIQPAEDKCWCSEFVSYLVGMAYKLDNNPDEYDPAELHEELLRRFGKSTVMNHPSGWQASKTEERAGDYDVSRLQNPLNEN